MPTLVSPGVSVSVIDESFYIPASAPTVPLFFVATRAGKTQPNNVTTAAGTNEHGVVRTVTSIGQSVQLYGVPYFWKDSGDNEHHGDARNEYGLMAVNQFLGVGNRAYVVRANIDLTDAAQQFVGIGTPVASTPVSVGTGNGTMSAITVTSANVRLETFTVQFSSATAFTVIGSLSGVIGTGTTGVAFTSSKVNFTVYADGATLPNGTILLDGVPITLSGNIITSGGQAGQNINAVAVPFIAGDYFTFNLQYAPTSYTGTGNGTMTNLVADSALLPSAAAATQTWTITFTSPTAFTVTGSVSGATAVGAVGTLYDNNFINFLITAGSTPFAVGNAFTVTTSVVSLTNVLGANDTAKRQAIVTALQAQINSNTEVRSELYEFNLILCPGFPEVADELAALSVAVNEEALVIADTPVDKTPEQVAVWGLTTARASGTNVAYYYPWGLASNLDGRNVVCAPSGIALRTYAYSDNQSYVWFAPAGARRGLVSGISSVGMVTGQLGGPTTYVETNLNQGQRDNLYEFQKNINPIVFFPGRGLLIWGQKTSAPAASALDRVNVVRLVMYLKRALRKGSFPFVFEPNDKVTRDNLKAAADGLLNDVLAKRGLYDFATLCDESNNTPDRIDRNEMYLDIGIKPAKAAEFIYIPITVLSTGAQLPG